MSPFTRIALLRGINVGGRNVVAMAELRRRCEEIGWSAVRTCIQSGNIVFHSRSAPEALEAELERLLERSFAVAAAAIVRTGEGWKEIAGGNPFPGASASEPNRVMLVLAKTPPAADALQRLRARATGGEGVERTGDALWIHYPAGVAGSKLVPGALDRLVGTPVTTRNWLTVCRIRELAAAT